ncbi:MAG: hypothetical protein N2Z64_05960 [Dictyoglomus thermophilum]|nr:hypothetical protein [Dictyoglomus thermophilum]MCX7720814.1 hypothetical protein [Dictyoglomus thermophilum]
MKKIIAIIIIAVLTLLNVVLADEAPGGNQTFSSKPPVEIVVETSSK